MKPGQISNSNPTCCQNGDEPRPTGTRLHPVRTPAKPGEPGTWQRVRMLLVDNSPAVIRAIESILATIAWVQVIGTASSGEEALERIGSLEPSMVLMDVAMPGMGGLEVTRSLVRSARRPRIIMMTAHVDDDYRQAAAGAGADGFILKADLGEGLIDVINDVRKRDGSGS